MMTTIDPKHLATVSGGAEPPVGDQAGGTVGTGVNDPSVRGRALDAASLVGQAANGNPVGTIATPQVQQQPSRPAPTLGAYVDSVLAGHGTPWPWHSR